MQDVDEFVFIRRRRRLRTNDAQETEAIVSLDQASDAKPLSGLIPEIAVLPEPARSAPALPNNLEPPSPKASFENIVTVEEFLRRSVQTVSKINQVTSGAVSQRKSRAYSSTGKRPMRVRQVTKVHKRPRESSRIAKALFRAAILTDGDPLDPLVDDAGISHTRRPLKFVPLSKFATPSGPDQTNSIEPSDLDHWEDPVPHTRPHGNDSDTRQRHSSHARVPLYWIPFQEAEAAYSTMFP